jgi:hypothetical protein
VRHVEAERLGGLEIDRKLVLGGPPDWKIARLGAFEYPIHEGSQAAHHLRNVWSIRDKPTVLNIFPILIKGWQTIPMPAAYVEIIKYALGEPIAALATLRGKLYGLEEASRLGFFHEVVEPDKLLDTAISYARCIAPDCNTAYAISKKALQDGVMRQIEERTIALDALLPAGMSDKGNRRAQDRRRQEIMHKR